MNSPVVEDKTSPMMMQWHNCKALAKNAVLFFRMGDFYEAFYDDAQLISRELDLTLTQRQGIPMSGVPYHTSETYIDKLVAKGYRVAVAEQMEDPKKTKGIVKREVVRVVTPGTVVNSTLLSEKSNNFFASLIQVGTLYGLGFLDLTTAEFRVIECENSRDVLNELNRIHPSEILTSEKFHQKHSALFDEIKLSYSCLVNVIEDWHFDHQLTHDYLVSHFKIHNLDGFGLKGMLPGIHAAGALLNYLKDTLCLPIDHIKQVQPYSTNQYMTLDRMTLRNLELTESLQDGSRKNTLLNLLDKTLTPMGGRLLRQWITHPLLSPEAIQARQDAIEELLSESQVMFQLGDHLAKVKDLERLMMKINSGYASPRDLVALRFSLEPIPAIKAILGFFSAKIVQEAHQQIENLENLIAIISKALVDEPPFRLTDGNVFRDGYHKELDELREISRDSKTWIARYQAQLREETGIKTLKVGFTKLFGYYIEVSKGQAEKMPDNFHRRQTLVNAERYITPELKSYEDKVLHAEEKMLAIESELFAALRKQISEYNDFVLKVAQAVATTDTLLSFATVAKNQHYVRPLIDDSAHIDIQEGRHPVIEASNISEKFIPNDTKLDHDNNRMLIITGPNMAGKSTYIRQVALMTIMAQTGSFVPAKEARFGIVDKVFSRIGASDDLTRGQSTFMVEMTETANILNNATDRSLVILDEIGRGTSTYDGISIAWVVAEYLLTSEGRMPKTLFATHYWELTKMESMLPGVANYHVAVRECEDHIIFLRKIVQGDTDKSYGIHVGRLAGLPQTVIARAKEILVHLEENSNRKNAFEPMRGKRIPAMKVKSSDQEFQLLLFEPSKKTEKTGSHVVLDELKKLNLDEMTPIQALHKLAEFKKISQDKK